MTGAKVYGCKRCPEMFTNPVKLGGHMRSAHPEHQQRPPKWLQTPTQRASRPSLKRATDIWPARP